MNDTTRSPAARGLAAILATAANQATLERDMEQLIAERHQNRDRIPVAELEPAELEPVPPSLRPISSGALSDEVKRLKSQAVTMGNASMCEGAKNAAAAFLDAALALKEKVDRWCDERTRQADELAETIARHHDSLRQAEKLFERAMSGEPEALPNPIPPRPAVLPDGIEPPAGLRPIGAELEPEAELETRAQTDAELTPGRYGRAG